MRFSRLVLNGEKENMKAEIKEEISGIFSIYANGEKIGSIHFGSEADRDNNDINLNVQPLLYSSKYEVTQVLVTKQFLHINLSKGEKK